MLTITLLMDENEVMKITKACVVLMQSKGEKTITSRTLQDVIRILYMEHPMLQQLVSSGTRYVTIFTTGTKVKINSFNYYNQIVRNHLGSGMYNEIYKVSASTIPYLCGVCDKLCGQEQQVF